MADFPVKRIGAILAVADVDRSVAFYRDHLGFAVEALYEDPAYAILVRDGVRLSLAEQGHPAADRPGYVDDAPRRTRRRPPPPWCSRSTTPGRSTPRSPRRAWTAVAPPYSPPWGGCRFFVADPDGYLVEVEQMA